MYYISTAELYHHGILGMKWGIRRFQPYPKGYSGDGKEVGEAKKVKQHAKYEYSINRSDIDKYRPKSSKSGMIADAKAFRDVVKTVKGKERGKIFREEHTIPKGTKVYRVTVDENDANNGSTYVTYMPMDRDLYRGEFSGLLLDYRNDAEGAWKYKYRDLKEVEYSLKEDIKVPSRKTLFSIYEDVLKDESLKMKIVEKQCDKVTKECGGLDYRGEEWEGVSLEEHLKKFKDTTMKDALSEIGAGGDRLGRFAAASMILDKDFKNSVIEKAKNLGYNAIVDEQGVQYGWEAVDPLIIFDGKNSMEKVNVQGVDWNEHYEYEDKTNRWGKNRKGEKMKK